jgi:PTS system mannitol-specific IIC component
MDSVNKKKDSGRARRVQQLGRFLSGMVMPNIGAFIAWGLLTALFIPAGWMPSARLARLADPMIRYLLPLLIGYTGGKTVYGHRGGVIGAVATTGMIVGTTVPMFLGGMIMGPLAGWVLKQIDKLVEKHIPTGFEMLVHNFSSGITGGVLAVGACVGVGPVVEWFSVRLELLVERIIDLGALPAAVLFIEPAKVLFLNNAVNHGVLSPLGIEQAAESGKSIIFLLETNPGPGLGILLAYLVFTKGAARHSAPGAMLIHFLGGIHEIYFPYILMQPKLLLAVMAGGASGVFTFTALHAGLVAVPSPGSIVALAAMAPRGGLFPVLAGVAVSTLVTFVAGAFLIDRGIGCEEDELAQAKEKMAGMKMQKTGIGHDHLPDTLSSITSIHCIAVACNGGMGSSAMGASKLRAALAEEHIEIPVISTAIDQLDEQADLVITHESLTGRAADRLPGAVHIAISDLMNTPVYRELAQRFAAEGQPVEPEPAVTEPAAPEEPAVPEEPVVSAEPDAETEPPVLQPENIQLHLSPLPRNEAIRRAGQILVDGGYVGPDYIDAMLEREKELSTYLGHGVAIPHGGGEAKKKIKHSGISILQFPEGIDFEGKTAYLVMGIAGVGNQHLKIIAGLAKIIGDDKLMARLREVTDCEFVLEQFLHPPDSDAGSDDSAS